MNDNTMHDMHSQSNESLARRLSKRLPGLCGGYGDFSQAPETCSGRALVPADAAGLAGQGGDIGGNQGTGVKP